MERSDELNQNADVRQLKAEISETQAELQETVAEIQDRLSPTTLKNQAIDTVKDAAGSVRDNVRSATVGRVQHMVRGQNPIPLALIGIGVAWLLTNRARGSSPYREYRDYDASWEGPANSGWRDERLGSSGSVTAWQGSWTETDESGSVSGVRHRAADVGRQARDSARRVATGARARWDHMLNDNPLALGIAALAAGALVGAAFPSTDIENEYLGETRDDLVESARTMAQDGVESARHIAKETIQKVAGDAERT
jgi:hypothetical protein